MMIGVLMQLVYKLLLSVKSIISNIGMSNIKSVCQTSKFHVINYFLSRRSSLSRTSSCWSSCLSTQFWGSQYRVRTRPSTSLISLERANRVLAVFSQLGCYVPSLLKTVVAPLLYAKTVFSTGSLLSLDSRSFHHLGRVTGYTCTVTLEYVLFYLDSRVTLIL